MGYRYYETAEVLVRFPFGYGLSYTEFSYGDLEILPCEVRFTVKNTGTFDGAEITQLYVGMKDSAQIRQAKELKGFRKVFLKSGTKQQVRIPFDDKSFRFFNTASGTWETEGGTHQIYV